MPRPIRAPITPATAAPPPALASTEASRPAAITGPMAKGTPAGPGGRPGARPGQHVGPGVRPGGGRRARRLGVTGDHANVILPEPCVPQLAQRLLRPDPVVEHPHDG